MSERMSDERLAELRRIWDDQIPECVAIAECVVEIALERP